MNCSYFAIPGAHPELSMAELKARVHGVNEHPSGFICLDEAPDFNYLGGTIELIKVAEQNIPQDSLYPILYDLLLAKNAPVFSVNHWPWDASKRKEQAALLIALKKDLKQDGLKTRFLNKDGMNVNRLAAFHEELAAWGTNIWIMEEDAETVSIGATKEMQDVNAYGMRDYEKPFRDSKVGMMPPKLAQIMINLAVGKNTDKRSIVDPFCGTGTVCIEAGLMGFHSVGSDVDPRMVHGAGKNAQWIASQSSRFQMPHFHSCDALKLSAENFEKTCAVVSELHLGPPLMRFPGNSHIQNIQNELRPLYQGFFAHLEKLLPPGTPIVVALPCWFKKEIKISMIDSIKMPTLFVVKDRFTYHRKDQVVGREILRIEVISP